MFASNTTDTIDIPFNPPHTVTLRKLNGRQLGKASKAFFNEMIAEVQSRGGAKVQKDIETLFDKDAASTAEQVKKVKADPLNGFDKYTLIYFGVKAWTCVDTAGAPIPLALVPTVEQTADDRNVTVMRIPAIEDLDDEAVEWFARAVLQLTKPSLFLTEEDAKAAQKETHADSSIAGR